MIAQEKSGSTAVSFSRPKDTSLEGYKAWLRNVLEALGGEDDMTDEEWEADWRKFWAKEPADEEPQL